MPECRWCQWGVLYKSDEGVVGYISSHRMPPFRDRRGGRWIHILPSHASVSRPPRRQWPNARMPVMPVGYRLFLRMLSVRLVLLSFPSYILKKEWNWCNCGIDICDPNARMPVMPVGYKLFPRMFSVWLAVLLFSFLYFKERVELVELRHWLCGNATMPVMPVGV